jgi:hypothetical protein
VQVGEMEDERHGSGFGASSVAHGKGKPATILPIRRVPLSKCGVRKNCLVSVPLNALIKLLRNCSDGVDGRALPVVGVVSAAALLWERVCGR